MPSSDNHSRYSPSDAASADTGKTAGDYFASDAPRTEGGDFIDQTISIWQKRTQRRLTREDGREIIENIFGFFSILQEWEQRERAAERTRIAISRDSKVSRRARRTAVEGWNQPRSQSRKGPK